MAVIEARANKLDKVSKRRESDRFVRSHSIAVLLMSNWFSKRSFDLV
jgi:hypothetical protein